jgi:CDP-diacylglycerol--glycerol-3-phosphate 3-phosphatidyltransferase
MVSLSGLLLIRALPSGTVLDVLSLVSYALLVVAVLLTAWSGADYFLKSWKTISEAE